MSLKSRWEKTNPVFGKTAAAPHLSVLLQFLLDHSPLRLPLGFLFQQRLRFLFSLPPLFRSLLFLLARGCRRNHAEGGKVSRGGGEVLIFWGVDYCPGNFFIHNVFVRLFGRICCRRSFFIHNVFARLLLSLGFMG